MVGSCYDIRNPHKITKIHPFVDGNKRTGFVTAVTILQLNGYRFFAEQEEVVRFMLRVAQGKAEIIEIETWLVNHVR